MNKIKLYLQQSWLLVVSAFVFGLLLATTNAAWQGKIKQNEIDKFNNLAGALFAVEGVEFEPVPDKMTVTLARGKQIEVEVKKAGSGDELLGWAFVCEGSGFQDKIKIVLAVDAGFEKLKGFGVLFSNETPGFGDKIKNAWYQDQFKGAPAKELTLSKTGDEAAIDDTIVAISGATVSSEAVLEIVNNYVTQIKKQLQTKGLIGNVK